MKRINRLNRLNHLNHLNRRVWNVTWVWVLALVLALMVGLSGCELFGYRFGESGASTPEATMAPAVRLTFAGSTTVQPLAKEIGKAYQLRYPGVELEIGAGGSRVGIEAVQNGSADIGMASRELREEEKVEGMEVHQIAIDVLAIIVHPSNAVEQISLEQLQGIYLGTITNWSEVGGADMPIVPVIREVTSGTRGAFDEIVLGGGEPTETAVTQATAGEVHVHVANTPGAIGYVGFGHLSGSDVKVVAINEVMPSPEAAMDGSYTLKRPLQLLTGPLSRPQAHDFVSFALSREGQQVVLEDGWVPVGATEDISQ